MTSEQFRRLTEELSNLLATTGQEGLFAFAHDCVQLLLPLCSPETASVLHACPPLHFGCSLEDYAAGETALVALVETNGLSFYVAAARYDAANLSSLFPSQPDATILRKAMQCVDSSAQAMNLALSAASAQERLEILVLLEGAPSLEVYLIDKLARANSL